MKLSMLIAALEALRLGHGDVDVIIHDADTDWPLAIDTVKYDPAKNRAEIGGDFYTQATTALDRE